MKTLALICWFKILGHLWPMLILLPTLFKNLWKRAQVHENFHPSRGVRNAHNENNVVNTFNYNKEKFSQYGRQRNNNSGNRYNNNYNNNQDYYRSGQRVHCVKSPYGYRQSNPRQRDPKNEMKNNKHFRGKNVLIGSSTSTNALSRAPRRFHYSVSKLRPDTDADTLRDHIGSFLEFENNDLSKFKVELINYKLFLFSWKWLK